MKTIKLMKFYVTDGVTKARVHYSHGQIHDGNGGLKDCVTLYAQDYDSRLGKVFTDTYENDSDMMTDYFDKGHVRIFPGNDLWDAALARA